MRWLDNRYKLGIIILDIAIINIIFYFSYIIRFNYLLKIQSPYNPFFAVIYTAIIILCLYFYKIYNFEKISKINLFFNIVAATSVGTILISGIGFFDWTFAMPRFIIASVWLANNIFLNITHQGINLMIHPKKKNIIVIGAGKKAHLVLNLLQKNKEHEIIGFLDNKQNTPIGNLPILGTLKDTANTVKRYNINEIIIALPPQAHDEILKIILESYNLGINIRAVPDLYDFILTEQVIKDGLIDLNIKPINSLNIIIKRTIDLSAASILLILTLPLMLFTSAIIKFDSKGSVIYKQIRQSKFSKPFILYKFRTMIDNAEKETGPIISDNKNDQRITSVGKFLRRTYLDELPQLINIIKGDMSLVGPRPERPELSKQFVNELIDWNKRLYIRPGLTGLAQIAGKTGLEPEEKLKYDLSYIKNQSLVLDLKILIRTIYYLFKKNEQ